MSQQQQSTVCWRTVPFSTSPYFLFVTLNWCLFRTRLWLKSNCSNECFSLYMWSGRTPHWMQIISSTRLCWKFDKVNAAYTPLRWAQRSSPGQVELECPCQSLKIWTLEHIAPPNRILRKHTVQIKKCMSARLHFIQGAIQPKVVSHRFDIIYKQMQRSSMKGLTSWTGSYLCLHKRVCPDPSTPCLLGGRGWTAWTVKPHGSQGGPASDPTQRGRSFLS